LVPVSGAATLVLTASGASGGTASVSGSLTLTATADAAVPGTAAATLTLTAIGTATSPAAPTPPERVSVITSDPRRSVVAAEARAFLVVFETRVDIPPPVDTTTPAVADHRTVVA
jgi:hypothetical protein